MRGRGPTAVGVVMLEQHRLLGQFVDIWRGRLVVTVAGYVLFALSVHDEDDYIRLVHCWSPPRRILS